MYVVCRATACHGIYRARRLELSVYLLRYNRNRKDVIYLLWLYLIVVKSPAFSQEQVKTKPTTNQNQQSKTREKQNKAKHMDHTIVYFE